MAKAIVRPRYAYTGQGAVKAHQHDFIRLEGRAWMLDSKYYSSRGEANRRKRWLLKFAQELKGRKFRIGNHYRVAKTAKGWAVWSCSTDKKYQTPWSELQPMR